MDASNLVKLSSSLAATGGNVLSTILTNRANAALADKANQWSLEQWQRENDYNLPVHQLERLRQAGINPNLAYANGSPMNEAASSPAVTSASGSQVAPQVDPLLMSQVNLMNAQAENQRADARNKDKDSILKDFDIRVQQLLDSGGFEQSNGFQKLTDNARVRHILKQNDLLDSQNAINVTQWHNLLWNLAVISGSDEYIRDNLSYSLDSYDSAKIGLRGDQKERQFAGDLAYWMTEAAKADHKGQKVFNDFVENHKDNELVQIILLLSGFMKSNGLRLPGVSFSHKW